MVWNLLIEATARQEEKQNLSWKEPDVQPDLEGQRGVISAC